ncbi:MAG TPA: hypothetical protein VH253_13790 [Phycisphaerae bacterium]|nr:hypothetical protein [Phycisphaerae bacterium]
MGLLHLIRQRLSDSLAHHPPHVEDAELGPLEQVAEGLWRTLEPLVLVAGEDPVYITIEGDGAGPSGDMREALGELQLRYGELRPAVEPLLRTAEMHTGRETVNPRATLVSVELYHHPVERHAVVALNYALADAPEYTFVVRVEGWKAVDVLVAG